MAKKDDSEAAISKKAKKLYQIGGKNISRIKKSRKRSKKSRKSRKSRAIRRFSHKKNKNK